MARKPTMVPQDDWMPIRRGEPESIKKFIGVRTESSSHPVSHLHEHHRLIAESEVGDEMIATGTKSGEKFRYFVTAQSKAKSIRWLRKHGHPVPTPRNRNPFGIIFQ